MPRTEQPLTEEERIFAARHEGLIWFQLKTLGLPSTEWYDVVAIGYLNAVKDWFQKPDIRRWAFATIVKRKVATAVSDCKRKLIRRQRIAPCFSLDAPVGVEGEETFYSVIASATTTEAQAEAHLFMEALAARMSGGQRAVFALLREGYTVGEAAQQLRIPRRAVQHTVDYLRRQYIAAGAGI